MLNSAVESEDSLSDEFTLCVEEVVQTEELPVESSEVPTPKLCNANADESSVVETVVELVNDLNNVAATNTCSSPATVSSSSSSNVSEFELVPEETTLYTLVESCAEGAGKVTADTENVSSKIDQEEADSGTREKKVESDPVCNGDSLPHRISDVDDDHCEEDYDEKKQKNKDAIMMRLNGVLPYTHVSVFNSNSTLVKPPRPKSVSENFTPVKIDTKKRKLSEDAPVANNVIPNGIVSSVEDTRDHEYAASVDSTLPQNINLFPSQEAYSLESVVKTKRLVARKHTSPTSISKTLKDVENTIRSELSKQEVQLSNGFVRHENVNVSTKECTKDQSTNTENPRKVNLSMDALSSNSVKNIFKTMRKTLTRRQLEEIVLQKVCEVISDSHEIGELKKQILELQQAEAHRKLTCLNLEKQMNQLKGVCQAFIDKANAMKREGKTSCVPTMVTRSVGLQVSDPSPVSKVSTSPSTFPVRSLSANPSGVQNLDEKKTASSLAAAQTSAHSSIKTNISNILLINKGRNSPLFDKPSSERSSPSTPVEESSIIDLTDKEDKGESEPSAKRPSTSNISTSLPNALKIVSGAGLKQVIVRPMMRHPAPLPKPTTYVARPGLPLPPPKPVLSISRNKDGISLSWNMPWMTPNSSKIARYQIYAYQETNAPIGNDPWKPVGEVNALPLPMECTLTQFYRGFRYHFTVRAVDELKRTGPFSEASSIAL